MALTEKYIYKRFYMRLAAACLDSVGSIPRLIFPSKKPAPAKETINKILVIRNDHLGDVLMTRPALQAVAEHFSRARVDFLVSGDAYPLFEHSYSRGRLIPFKEHWFSRKRNLLKSWQEGWQILQDIRSENYDLAIDFRGDLRNIFLMFLAGIPQRYGYGITGGGFLLTNNRSYSRNKHQVLVNMDLLDDLGISSTPAPLKFDISQPRSEVFASEWEKVIRPADLPLVAIHAGAGYASKRWPAQSFHELIDRIVADRTAFVILIGTADESRLLPDLKNADGKLLDLRGKTTLGDLLALFDICDAFLGNDSGPAHIAAAQEIPVISVFSAVNRPEQWRPWTDKLNLITREIECSPCESRECPLGHHRCMTEISVTEVYAALKTILRQKTNIHES